MKEAFTAITTKKGGFKINKNTEEETTIIRYTIINHGVKNESNVCITIEYDPIFDGNFNDHIKKCCSGILENLDDLKKEII